MVPAHSSLLNPFLNKLWFLHACSTSLLKTLWEKEKLLITSNFSFSYSVFHLFGEFSTISITFKIVVCKLFQFGRVQNLLFGKGFKVQDRSKGFPGISLMGPPAMKVCLLLEPCHQKCPPPPTPFNSISVL